MKMMVAIKNRSYVDVNITVTGGKLKYLITSLAISFLMLSVIPLIDLMN